MNEITKMFIDSIGKCGKKRKTATVYLGGKEFATYSVEIAKQVAEEIGGCVVDDETGEIL